MPATSIVGLETMKNVIHRHGVDQNGKVTLKKRSRGRQLSDCFANLPPCVIGMEAT